MEASVEGSSEPSEAQEAYRKNNYTLKDIVFYTFSSASIFALKQPCVQLKVKVNDSPDSKEKLWMIFTMYTFLKTSQ